MILKEMAEAVIFSRQSQIARPLVRRRAIFNEFFLISRECLTIHFRVYVKDSDQFLLKSSNLLGVARPNVVALWRCPMPPFPLYAPGASR